MMNKCLAGRCVLLLFLLCKEVRGDVTLKQKRFPSENEPRQRYLRDPPNITNYELLEPSKIKSTLLEWAQLYPNLARVTTAQEEYGLPTAGGTNDCPFDEGVVGCLNYILVLQDFVAHPEGSESSNKLPEVFWSGELHGNERVGPTAVLEAAKLLLEATSCESHPRMSVKPKERRGSGWRLRDTSRDQELWQSELEEAELCRRNLSYSFGIEDHHRQWLARLLSTRRIVVVPTANALGYFQNVREEAGVDPNRDFPYDLTDPKDCMQSIAARTLNEIYREHMFQLSLTFHGGMEVIGYEWGAPTWGASSSPDDIAQSNIAAAYSRFAGNFGSVPSYGYGAMNDLVYPVRGGFEDWAYAASFDTTRVIQCEPNTKGGYPKKKTIYTDSTLRTFNMLIETSNDKIPSKELLGTSLDILNPGSSGNGHVTRNIRLSLLSTEMVEPYVSIKKVDDVELSDDTVPMVLQSGRSCLDTKTIRIPFDSSNVVIEWNVGGAFEVDDTRLWFAKWDEIPESILVCGKQPSIEAIDMFMRRGAAIGSISGTGQFSPEGASVFRAQINLSASNFQPGDKIAVIASAVVDQSWADTVNDVAPNLPPQSHIVNARTNPDWYHESGGKIMKGRLDWFSEPLTLELAPYRQRTGVRPIEVSNRMTDACFTADEIDELTTWLSWIGRMIQFNSLVQGSSSCFFMRFLLASND